MLDIYLSFKWVRGEVDFGVHQVVGDISCRFCNGAEQGWAPDPSHLHCRRHHDPHWLPLALQEDICKVEAVHRLYNEALEAVADVQLAE